MYELGILYNQQGETKKAITYIENAKWVFLLTTYKADVLFSKSG